MQGGRKQGNQTKRHGSVEFECTDPTGPSQQASVYRSLSFDSDLA
jgi:hypothetical protein